MMGFHNGAPENFIYVPEYNLYLAVDADCTNVYDRHENLVGSYPTEEEAREAIRRCSGKGDGND